MKPAPFQYRRASSVRNATIMLREFGDDAKVIAGGQSLVAMMNLRLAQPTTLIDLNDIRGLAHILRDGRGLRIGALTRHVHLETYPADLGRFAILQRAACWIGHLPIRTQGTIGGSIAHADPAAEWCILALLLDAQIVVQGPSGIRRVAAADFFQGYFSTALEQDEIVVEVAFPRGAAHASLQEYAPRHGDFAVVAAAVAFELDDGVVRQPRVAVGGVAARAVRLPEVEQALEGMTAEDRTWRSAAEVVAEVVEPPSDAHASATYRRSLASGLVHRALAEAASRDDTEGYQ
jgi:carbon-monoxide dehydrogenase medium subunit